MAGVLSRRRATVELTLALLIVMGGLIAMGWWLTESFPLPRVPSPLDVLGWAIAVVAALSLAYCARSLSRVGHGTPYPRLPPAQLVATGPFAHVRNPIILSWGWLLIGLALGLRLTGLLALLAPATVAVHLYIVYHEEPILRQRFGAAFEDYCRRVPRWIPRWRT